MILMIMKSETSSSAIETSYRFDGRLNELTGKYQDMKVKAARDQIVAILK
jgi:valyl-tRNA synthetase